MADTKVSAQNEKQESLKKNNKNIQPGYWHGIWL